MAKKKNPAAVALGRLGGSVKGVAKGFGALDKDGRKSAAREAANARWDAYREAQKKSAK